MALPIGQQRHEQVWAAQQRRVGGRGAAQRDVVAAARAAVGAVDVERLCGKPSQSGFSVQRFQHLLLVNEARRRRDVDLDDAGVGGDGHRRQARVGRWSVALDDNRTVGLGGGGLDPADQVDEMFQFLGGRHVDVEQPIADLGHHRGGGRRIGILDHRGLRLDVRLGIAGQVPRRASGSASYDGLGGCQLIEFSGSRRPAGESPSTARCGRDELPVGTGPPGVVVAAVQRQDMCGGLGDGLVSLAISSARGSAASASRSSPAATGSPSGCRTALASRASAPRRSAAPGCPAGQALRRRRRAPAVRRPARSRSFQDRLARVGQQRITVPERFAVSAPQKPNLPARQRFSRIPFAFAR